MPVSELKFSNARRKSRSPQTAESRVQPEFPASPPYQANEATVSYRRGRELLEEHLDLIQKRLQQMSRRSGLPDHEAEEFRSWALYRLVEDDYRVLASWKGKSSFPTYLTTVLVNLMRDYRIHVWGKWRVSAAARRQGPEAELLERLWLRDGIPLDEVIERMRTEHGVSLLQEELERLAAGLPRRAERRRVGEEELLRVPVDGKVEDRIEDKERGHTATRLGEILAPALQALPDEDRLLLKLHYQDGLSMSAISPLLSRTQRELYSRRDRCLRKLRGSLEKAGLSAAQVKGLFGWSGWGYRGPRRGRQGVRESIPSRRPAVPGSSEQ
jgi:RNA polymerase sigma factor (sigma-70 family)